eukprot:1561217-Rhodomonas_salina.1
MTTGGGPKGAKMPGNSARNSVSAAKNGCKNCPKERQNRQKRSQCIQKQVLNTPRTKSLNPPP